jgi:hypothetical protein
VRRVVLTLAVALVGALLAPGTAHAVDNLRLTLDPSQLSGKPGWRLVGATGDTGGETFGVTLERSSANGRSGESHAFRGRPRVPTLTYDGRTGRWDTQRQFGNVVAVRMAISNAGDPEPLPEVLGCRGDFIRVPVVLQGTFVLRTGTRFFGTIRRSRLSGVITFNRGGPADCTPAATTSACEPRRDFGVQSRNLTTVLAGLDSGGWLTLSFVEPVRRLPATWYHVMLVGGFNPYTGALPSVGIRVPAGQAVAGRGTFTAQQQSESTSTGCRTTTTSGTFRGTFRATFRGWGSRTTALRDAAAQLRVV